MLSSAKEIFEQGGERQCGGDQLSIDQVSSFPKSTANTLWYNP